MVRNLTLDWVNPGVKSFMEVPQKHKAGNSLRLFKVTHMGNSWQHCFVLVHLSFLHCVILAKGRLQRDSIAQGNVH